MILIPISFLNWHYIILKEMASTRGGDSTAGEVSPHPDIGEEGFLFPKETTEQSPYYVCR